MVCQACGVEAPTKYVEFYYNIGALVLRFSKSIKGSLCKSCIHKYFWQFTLIDLTAGWWGMISFIITPFFILNNVGRYAMCLGMPAVPEGAVPPRLTDEAIDKLQPYTKEIVDRLNDGERMRPLSDDIAL